MINQTTIDQVFEAANIEDVVGEVVKLDKSGVNLKGCCPFHDEKTPSFVVSPAKGMCHCFGCGEGGNPVSFTMKYHKINFPDAIRKLADKYNIIVNEEVDPEFEKKREQKNNLIDFYKMAAMYFKQQLFLPDHAKALQYIKSRFTDETISQWAIGFAPKGFQKLYHWFIAQGLDDDFLISSGLVKRSSKNQKVYDFFQNRIIFPVFDQYNNIISFSGRAMPGDDKQAKYINLSDTLTYKKSKVLYGLNLAIQPIIRTKSAIIVEGNPDAIHLHEIGINNVVAPSGTALADGQILLLQKFAEKITLLYDGDTAGQKALIKNGQKLVEKGIIPYAAILPDGEDPDSFFKDESQFNDWMNENKKDFLHHYATKLFTNIGDDPSLKNDAINKICDLLFPLSSTKQQLYLETFTKQSKIKGKLFADRLKELEARNIKPEDKKRNIPADVDANEYDKWGFYIDHNAYHFNTKSGPEKLSNFAMKPVFHIDSIIDSKRIYELVNEHGYRVVVNLDMNEMTSLQGFQRNVESKGNFMFWGQMSNFQKLKLKLYEETRTCVEVKNLGWQKEGFWAWANGMATEEGVFEEIDEYGVVRHNEQDYFIPAFSKIYISDKSIFLDERKFMYRKSPLALKTWMVLYLQVHGPNAMVAFAWYLAVVFRDHILYLNDNFPLLNLFGQKGSGKNTLAYSLLSLFGKKQTEYNIHNGTKPGLAKHLEMFRNAIAFVDEYKNSLEYDKIETLKSIYNAIGRSRLNMDKGGKKETTEVNQGVIVAGQEMPTIDVALSSRMLFLQFLTKEGLIKKQKDDFERLQNMERDGLPHLTMEFLSVRKYFTDNYKISYDSVMKTMGEATKGEDINDRLLRNMATVIAAFKTLEPRFEFSWTTEQLMAHGLQVTRDHNRQINQSDEIGVFWNLLEAMFDDNILIDGWHFQIKMTTSLKTKNRELTFESGKRVLKFKFNAIAKLYSEQIRRSGDKPLPKDSLQHYLLTNKHFLGVEKSCRFSRKDYLPSEGILIEKTQITTAFCFDYDQLEKIVNLERYDIEDRNPYNTATPAPSVNESTNGHKVKQQEMELNTIKAKDDNLPF